jgi:3-deoxy-7-phosphoheptulonate synthase
MSRAAVAAGADALILEVHQDPDRAVSDGRQSIDLKEFDELMQSLRRAAAAVDRGIAVPETSPAGVAVAA